MMACYTGLPGAGKSYGANLAIMLALERTDKFVATNCAVNLDELNAYYQEETSQRGKPLVDVYKRVRIITTEEAREFWRFRGTFTVLPDKPVPRKRTNAILNEKGDDRPHSDIRPNTAQVVDIINEWYAGLGIYVPGVLYVIEEAHLLFDARSWQATSETLTFYNSQHRKFRDDAIFVTQFLKMLEVRVKGFCEEFHVFKNFAGRRTMQFLRMPSRMRELTYTMDPNAPGATPDHEVWRSLDVRRAKCYNTMRGVGVGGANAPEERKVKGFSVPWWTPLILLVLAGIVFVAGSKFIAKKALEFTVRDPKSLEPKPKQETPSQRKPHKEDPPPQPVTVTPALPQPTRKMVGSVVGNGTVRVVLDDGTVLRPNDLLRLDTDKAVGIDGTVYWYGRPFQSETKPKPTQKTVKQPAKPPPARSSE